MKGKYLDQENNGKKRRSYGKIIISSDFEKTILLYDVGNYNYDVGKTQKRVTKATGYV